MADRSGLSIALETLADLIRALYSIPWSRYLSWLGRVIALPFKLTWISFSYLATVMGIVFAPALYLFSYFLSWGQAVVAFFVSLQPLYTFFGTAAAVGIVAGLTLATSSSIITSFLGMQDEPYEETRPPAKKPLQYSTLTKDGSSSEADWYWAEPSPSRRRPATGLLSQTIIEEEDDSDI